MKKLLEAFDGHKTELGLVLAALPDIANQVIALLNTIAPVFVGLHMDGPASAIAHASGLILAGVGAIHRVAKIVLPLIKA